MEVQDIIGELYSAARFLSCDEPDCPMAHVLDDLSGSTNTGGSHHEDALILVLLGIADNLSECLDLLRILVSRRNNTNRLEHLTQSGTTSHSGREGTTRSDHGPLSEPPIPSLYHDQWYQSPAVSPPAYTAFCHSCPRSFPRAPAPSPASEATSSNSGTPTPDDQDRVVSVRESNNEPGRPPGLSFPALSTFDLPIGPPLRHHSPPSSNGSGNWPRSRFAARVNGDSEAGQGLGNGPNSHLGESRGRPMGLRPCWRSSWRDS